MAEWARVVNTTIKDYLYGEEDKLMANRKLLAMIKSKGNIEYNKGGDGFQWQVPYKRAPLTVNNGEQPVSPSRQDRWKDAVLDFQGYAISDMMTKREKLKNTGRAALVKVFEQMLPRAMDDFRAKFSEELYIDSGATGNSGRITGIESMMGSTQTVNVGTGAARTANAADVVGYPNATYAGLSTVLANYSGTWGSTAGQTGIASTWPAGRGDEGYDFWSPTIVNYTSSAFNNSANTWAQNCVSAIRYMIDHLGRYLNEEGPLDMILLDRDLYRQFKEKLDPSQRIVVQNNLGLRALGFKDTIELDGVDITSEFGMPSSVGYGFNVGNMTMRSMQDKLFDAEGPVWVLLQRAYVVIIDCLCQLKFQSPRYFGKLVSLA